VLERFVSTVAALPRSRSLAARLQADEGRVRHPAAERQAATPETLFPFYQATLAHAARILGAYGIDPEVVGIPAA